MGYPKNDFSVNVLLKGFPRMRASIGIWLVILFSSTFLYAQTAGAKMAETLRKNTVRVQGAQNGFGFIVGERNGFIYIATARHILIDNENPDAPPVKKVQIVYYADQGKTYVAEVLGTHDGDLAVIRASTPSGFDWVRASEAPTSNQYHGTQVWFVGRRDQWYVPGTPGAIASDRPSSKSQIEVDGLAVAKGTSGAPLISDQGIVGMILQDSADDTRALTLDFIRRDFEEWNYPWDLTTGQRGSEKPEVAPAKSCSVSVRSTPSGARLTLDGAARGVTPTTLELTAGQTYALSLQKEKYTDFDQDIDCGTRNVSATLQATVGTIMISYAGDQFVCSLQIKVTIGDKRVTPTSNNVTVRDVPLGDQPYTIDGQIGCPGRGICRASGGGTLEVRDGATYNLIWANTGYAACNVELR
jgi:hypothetical protein